MPDISSLIQSKYLSKSDLGPRLAALLTIVGGEAKNVAKQGAAPDVKWVLKFKETAKEWPLSNTKLRNVAQITGSQNTDGFVGKQIVVYYDPNVKYMGQIVGGLDVRAPAPRPEAPPQGTVQQQVAAAAAAAAPAAPAPFDDDIPF
jgi:hypothetical protein